MTTDVRRRSAAIAMGAALARLDTALALLEAANKDAALALPAGHDLLGEFDVVLPDVRILRRKAEQALARVPVAPACGCGGGRP